MRFLGPHSAGEGPHLVPISLKFGSPSGPHFEKSGSPGLVGTVQDGADGEHSKDIKEAGVEAEQSKRGGGGASHF